MNSLLKFDFYKNEIRTLLINDEPWFVGKDVAEVLGYSEPRSTVSKKVDPEDRGVADLETPSGVQKMTIVNESGLYALIFGSKLPRAKEFKHWVTSVVLPEIRKTGSFNSNVDDKYIEALVSISTSISVMVENTSNMCALVMKQTMGKEPQNSQILQNCEISEVNKCKLDGFPVNIRNEVNSMLNQMIKKKAMNYSEISRFCTLNGYPISQPAVKRYYLNHFKK